VAGNALQDTTQYGYMSRYAKLNGLLILLLWQNIIGSPRKSDGIDQLEY
jgi:hypothetical protein